MTISLAIDRLVYIKQLFNQGVAQAKQGHHISFSSILSFHDAIDMFLGLSAEFRGITQQQKKQILGSSKNVFMMDYFTIMPDLTQKASVERINTRRNNLKHHGLIPANMEINQSMLITELFFEENCMRVFGIEFKDIALHTLIQFKTVQSWLIAAEKELSNGNLTESIKEVAKAFFELQKKVSTVWQANYIAVGIDDKTGLGIPSFSTKENQFYIDVSGWNGKDKLPVPEGVAGLVWKLNHHFARISNSLNSFILGADFQEHLYFKMFVPEVVAIAEDGTYFLAEINPNVNLTAEKCRFAIQFVSQLAINYRQLENMDNKASS